MSSARAGCANAASSARISRRRAIRFLNIAVARLRRSAGGVQASPEAVRIDIDRHAHLGLPVEPAEPVAEPVLSLRRGARADQQESDRRRVGNGWGVTSKTWACLIPVKKTRKSIQR